METGKKKFAVVGVITGVVVILLISLICILVKPSESQGKCLSFILLAKLEM